MRSVSKRCFDLSWTLLGLALLAPLLVVVAILVKIHDGGPVFFRQVRVGHRGRPFRLWKFRTMVPDASARGLALTVGRDPRLTRLGAWLRRLKLDELPQLFNVLAGEMSLVGP
ncbi:MAG: sugar transferase, partial [Bryobacteraceae bacterium]